MKAIVNAKLKTMAPKKRGVKVKEEYESGVILIDGDKIKAVGSAKDVKIPKNAEIIDAKGRLVLPGFPAQCSQQPAIRPLPHLIQ